MTIQEAMKGTPVPEGNKFPPKPYKTQIFRKAGTVYVFDGTCWTKPRSFADPHEPVTKMGGLPYMPKEAKKGGV